MTNILKLQRLASNKKLPDQQKSRKAQAIKQRKINHQNQPRNDTDRFKKKGTLKQPPSLYSIYKETTGKIEHVMFRCKRNAKPKSNF